VRMDKEAGNAMGEDPVRIEALSPEERLELLERLWDSLSRKPASVPLTDPQRVELDRRLDALDEDVSQGRVFGVPWDEVVREIRTRG
jgi:putative addiction module component (TIGR02574 family)